MIVSGDVVPRRDTDAELYVAGLSNEAHIRADTGRVITCPFIPGALPDWLNRRVCCVPNWCSGCRQQRWTT